MKATEQPSSAHLSTTPASSRRFLEQRSVAQIQASTLSRCFVFEVVLATTPLPIELRETQPKAGLVAS